MLGKLFEFPPIFHYKLLPKFPTAHGAVWNSGPDDTSLPDCARGAYLTTYCSELLGWKFFPDFFITGCNVFFISTTLEHFFTVGLMLFPLWWENLHVCGHSVPFFIVFSAMSFLYGFSFGLFIYQSARGYISQPTVLELCFGPFFPVFHHRL